MLWLEAVRVEEAAGKSKIGEVTTSLVGYLLLLVAQDSSLVYVSFLFIVGNLSLFVCRVCLRKRCKNGSVLSFVLSFVCVEHNLFVVLRPALW